MSKDFRIKVVDTNSNPRYIVRKAGKVSFYNKELVPISPNYLSTLGAELAFALEDAADGREALKIARQRIIGAHSVDLLTG